MKRIIVFVLTAILVFCSFAMLASALEENAVVDETIVETTTPVVEPVEEEQTITETIASYFQEHFEEISVVVTLILTVFYNIRKNAALNKTIGLLNNNAIVASENSSSFIKDALVEVDQVKNTVCEYSEKIEALLAEVRENFKEKEHLAEMLAKAEAFIETAKLATKELADEIAELLVLANIPQSVKDELYARHIAAVNAIADAEHTEVIHNDGEKA